MFTIHSTKKQADETFKDCDRCNGSCPESNCMWAGVLANGGEGKIYCTVPDLDEDERITRFGI